MIWNRKFDQKDRKKFLHLIDFIVEAIHSGELAGGEALPTQRALSKQMGVSIGTITKAFKELEKMGYLVGEVGRGTYVRDISREFSEFWYRESRLPYRYNLGHYRTTELFNHRIQLSFLSSVRAVMSAEDLYGRLHDLRNFGTDEQKEAFLRWCVPLGIPAVPSSCIAILAAEMLSILVVVEALTDAGETILVEELGDRITRDQLLATGRQVDFVKMDNDGLMPDHLERLIIDQKARLLITNPTFHNPTGLSSSKKRKVEICEVCARHGVRILEDGKSDGFQGTSVNPYFALNPEVGIYLAGLYFHINPSLTTSAVIASQEVIKRIEDFYALAYWSGSQLLQELCLHLLTSGNGGRILQEKRMLLKARNTFFNDTFALGGSTYSPLRWLPLPNHTTSAAFANLAYEQGILVRNSDIFSLNPQLAPPQAVRIAHGAIHDEDQYRKAIGMVGELRATGRLSKE